MQGRGQRKSIYLGRHWRHLATLRPIILFPFHPPRPPGVQLPRGATLEMRPAVPHHLSTCCSPFHFRLIVTFPYTLGGNENETYTSSIVSFSSQSRRRCFISISIAFHFRSNCGRAGGAGMFHCYISVSNRSISVPFSCHLDRKSFTYAAFSSHSRLVRCVSVAFLSRRAILL